MRAKHHSSLTLLACFGRLAPQTALSVPDITVVPELTPVHIARAVTRWLDGAGRSRERSGD
jgi:hypothetical protein